MSENDQQPHQPYPIFEDAMEYLRQLNKELAGEDPPATTTSVAKKPPPPKPRVAGIHLVPFHPDDPEPMVAARCDDGTLVAGVIRGGVLIPHFNPCPTRPEQAPLLRLRLHLEWLSKEQARRFLDTEPMPAPDTTRTPTRVTSPQRHFPRPRQSCAANS